MLSLSPATFGMSVPLLISGAPSLSHSHWWKQRTRKRKKKSLERSADPPAWVFLTQRGSADPVTQCGCDPATNSSYAATQPPTPPIKHIPMAMSTPMMAIATMKKG
ncbi:hypothetical protein FH972_013777 [Carpinus fangiana]|uniref:Uncharacterized protein n=1 Tax=Carpinus fangiana TaxID=176857 RepID=A0A5N6R812_9ROSI|nr:hypothetical protein FH972_013777 [Carpinus fangiana]